jgi:Secretion system C-terminal sorting domain
MRQSIFLTALSFIFFNIYSQNPAGVSGSVLWLKANTNASPSSWNDNSSQANHFTQGSVPDQPSLATNLFNFNPGFQFNGVSSHFGNALPANFPTGIDSRTIFAVANSNSNTGYHWLLTYGNPGTINGTCQLGSGNVGAELTSAFFGSSSDMSTPTSFWDNPLYSNGSLVSFTMASGTLTQTLRDRGVDILSVTPYRNDLSASSSNAFLGRLGPPFGEFWDGNMAEVIIFNTDLGPGDRNQVESYLALKYGFTLGSNAAPTDYTASDGATGFWVGDAFFQNDVFGIGTDAGSDLVQTQSNSSNSGDGSGIGESSKGNLTLSVGTALADKQFLMIGNDGVNFNESTIITGQAPPSAVGARRVARNWKAQNTGGVGAVNLGFDMLGFSFSGGSTLLEYRLMVDNDGDEDYATGTPSFFIPSSLTGTVLDFNGVTLPNNATFTIITQVTGSTLPAIWKDFVVQIKGNNAYLNWKTTNEYSVGFYSVEHSLDGLAYQEIGKTNAINAAGLNNYSFTHENLLAGKHYYRVKLVDVDGKYQYSATRTISIAGKIQERIVIKSNPVKTNQLDLIIDVSKNTRGQISIISLQGKIIQTLERNLAEGSNHISADVSSLPGGTYLIKVAFNDKVYINKFMRL